MPGRCAGCERTDKSADTTREHTRYCPAFKVLFEQSPERALDPETEYRRWVELERGIAREGIRQIAIREAERRRAVQAERWATPPDILDEEELWETGQCTWTGR